MTFLPKQNRPFPDRRKHLWTERGHAQIQVQFFFLEITKGDYKLSRTSRKMFSKICFDWCSYRNLVIFVILGGFLHIFFSKCGGWDGLLERFFKDIEPIYILVHTLTGKFFLNLPENSKYCRKLVIFSSLFCVVFFIFAVS